jgi:serine/threonine-protein kinase
MCAVKADLHALFPTPGSDAGPGAETSVPWHTGDELPRIPGYEVEALLGRGGMGLVYKARHLRLNRSVALKMLITGAYAGPHERARFQREAEAAAGLHHANIVQVHDAGDHQGWPYFTMELLEGGSLAQALAGTPQPARRAAALLTTLAEAVQVAHRGGIVHRDLKPANILLTADGTPKVADIGLARHVDGEPAFTLSGARIGTPSYMAPEQVIGKAGTIGPAADIYALGVLLYEMLTGRPPFRGETASETERQVIHDEPVSPSRLNPKVPRDLETICLKCLSKEPGRRYASAAALADDLTRFREGRPIQARPLGWVEHSWRWCRRNATAAALLITALALVGLASGGGVWLVQQRAERRAEMARQDRELHNDLGTAVAQAASLRQRFHFGESRKLLGQVRQRLEPAGPDDLQRQVKQAWADLDLAERLDAARVQASLLVRGRYGPAGAEPLYASAFAEAGLGRGGDDIKAMATRVQASELRTEIVDALDDWAGIAPSRARRIWLLAVAREADPDLSRNRLRQPELWQNGVELLRLARELKVAESSPHLATVLGRVASENRQDAAALLTVAQAHFPEDFWLNLETGSALDRDGRIEEALGYFRAAVALRRNASVAHNGLAVVFRRLGRVDESIDHHRQALRLDPKFALAHSGLGLCLQAKGRLEEALDHFRQALEIEPHLAEAHFNFGVVFYSADRLDEAISQFKQALGLDPQAALDPHILGSTLPAKSRPDEPIDLFAEAVRTDPKSSAAALNNIGNALRDSGRVEEAVDYLQLAIRIDPMCASAYNNLGLAMQMQHRVDEAIHHFQESIRLEPKSAMRAHSNIGFALQSQGRLDEAIGHFQHAVKLDPKFITAQNGLGICLHDAACAALKSAAKPSAENSPLGEPDRVGLRRQAMDWLKANLDLTAAMRGRGLKPPWSLSTWQVDPALAAVREPTELAKLPQAERAQWQRFWAEVTAQIAADPVEHGRACAARREWAKAADGYAHALKHGPTDDGHFWFEYAALSLLSGDHPGHARVCAHMIERCGKAGGPRSYHVARACTLAPDAVAQAALAGRLAEKELQGSREFWSLTEQGALAYRAGRFHEAVLLFEQSLRANPKPGAAVLNWLWLALAHQRLGKTEESRRWLEKAGAWLDQYRDGMTARAGEEFGLHYHNWLEAHVLRREAEALIPSEGPRSVPKNREPGAAKK